MKKEYIITTDEFCANHKIDLSFINSLQRSGLLEMDTINDAGFIQLDQLKNLEKIINFYFGLDINLEGIETITHLLHQIDENQHEILRLTNRLRLYESE